MSLKGTTVFMIMYNYAGNDYSVIKIMETKESAFSYICHQECKRTTGSAMKLTTISTPADIQELQELNLLEEYYHVFYIASGKYNKFDLCDILSASNYVIVPMTIC